MEISTVTNTTYINAQSVCALLVKLAKTSSIPISIVLDNAKYQRCNLVTECAKDLGIELIFLPSYSPQLNLIERFWKLVKSECLYCKYYETFHEFKSSIQEFIESASITHKKELKSLLTWNFQSFEKLEILSA